LSATFRFGTELVPGYKIVGEITAGTSATIYRAQDAAGNQVAIKLLSEYSSMVAEKLTKRLGKPWEGPRIASLSHPNIVKVFRHGKTGDRYYIVMEYLPGGNLGLLLQYQDDPLKGRRLDIVKQIGRALAYVHSKGIIHRDMYPRNILFTSDGVPKLIDFGVAMQKGDRLRDTGVRTGRPRYMAPEVIKNNTFSELSDIFAFGITIFDTFGGRNPITATDRSVALLKQLEVELPPIRQFNPAASQDLERLIQKATQKDMALRFRTMEELLRALNALPPSDSNL